MMSTIMVLVLTPTVLQIIIPLSYCNCYLFFVFFFSSVKAFSSNLYASSFAIRRSWDIQFFSLFFSHINKKQYWPLSLLWNSDLFLCGLLPKQALLRSYIIFSNIFEKLAIILTVRQFCFSDRSSWLKLE